MTIKKKLIINTTLNILKKLLLNIQTILKLKKFNKK